MDKLSNSNLFWPSYSDLMTTLFLVMMALYILTFVKLRHDKNEFRTSAEKYEKLREIERTFSSLNSDLFYFNEKTKRHKLLVEVEFKPHSSDINDLTHDKRSDLIAAGKELFVLMSDLAAKEYATSYLLVVEGSAARAQFKDGRWNYLADPDLGYRLSYNRALALYHLWTNAGYDIGELRNCEVLIAGSGYFGEERDADEALNKRFTIQITGKLGDFK